jgi:hypothetical protein
MRILMRLIIDVLDSSLVESYYSRVVTQCSWSMTYCTEESTLEDGKLKEARCWMFFLLRDDARENEHLAKEVSWRLTKLSKLLKMALLDCSSRGVDRTSSNAFKALECCCSNDRWIALCGSNQTFYV